MARFNIQDFMSKNKFELGSIKKEIGNTAFKGGHNDLRKTNYDVNIKGGRLDLYTHNEVITEDKTQINERKISSIEIADIFVRFLIGDRETAIKQLNQVKDAEFGVMETPGTAEYNKQFGRLTAAIDKAIKSNM